MTERLPSRTPATVERLSEPERPSEVDERELCGDYRKASRRWAARGGRPQDDPFEPQRRDDDQEGQNDADAHDELAARVQLIVCSMDDRERKEKGKEKHTQRPEQRMSKSKLELATKLNHDREIL
jgi:hypothetical protein